MSSYEHGLEFDAYQEGIKAERERIIKLLKEVKEPDMKFHKFETLVNIDRIIALIEGENK